MSVTCAAVFSPRPSPHESWILPLLQEVMFLCLSLSIFLTLFLRKCQMHAQPGKSSGKTPAQPCLDRLRFYYSSAESMGKQAIDNENRKGHGHEDAAQKQKL